MFVLGCDVALDLDLGALGSAVNRVDHLCKTQGRDEEAVPDIHTLEGKNPFRLSDLSWRH